MGYPGAGQFVALKRIRLDSQDEGVPCTALREISLLKELKHEHIVALLDVLHSDVILTLVFEFCQKDLRAWLDEQAQTDAQTVRVFLRHLLLGLHHCHHSKVLHRDLKPQNLLIHETEQSQHLKLADFGLARACGIPVREYSDEVVTLWYRPPDVLMGFKRYTTAIDLWSVGCIFAEMLTRQPLFQIKESDEQDAKRSKDFLLDLIVRTLGTPAEDSWSDSMHDDCAEKIRVLGRYPRDDKNLLSKVPQLHNDDAGLDLLKRCLEFDDSKRILASEALEHEYLNGGHTA